MILFFCAAALLCFAGNSLLCRAALSGTGIDAASFTLVRLMSGAVVLALLLRGRAPARNWRAAAALVGYAALFSLAYRRIDTGVGALVLFGAVQVTMVGAAVWRSARPSTREGLGLLLALAGLASLTLKGKSAPDVGGAALMAAAGVAWGVYSLIGRKSGDALRATAGSFLLGSVLVVPVAGAAWLSGAAPFAVSTRGLVLAALSGGVTSGIGYSLWYRVLPRLSRQRAAVLQLLVPIIAAAGGIAFLGETVSARLALAGALVLGGVALVFYRRGG